MRIATLIIGLLLGLMLFIQSFTVGMFSETAVVDDTTSTAGAAGLMMALLWLLACALVIPLPQVSFPIFLVSAIIGLTVPTGEFGDLRFHGAAAILLTVLAFFGWRGKRKERRTFKLEKARQEERDARMEQLLRQQVQAQQSSAQFPCPTCQRLNPVNVRYCGNCGTPLVANA